MRKFLFKSFCLLVVIAAVFFWFQSDNGPLSTSSVLGMDDSNGWLTAHSQDSRPFDVLETVNAHMLRVEIPWNEVEPSAGAYIWAYQSKSGYMDYDQLFARLEKRGIQPVVVLTGGPAYLNNLYPQQPVSSDKLLERWQNFVSAAVQQFGSQVNYWQIGGVINDPSYWGSLFFPSDESGAQADADIDLYAKMLKSAYTIIKSANAGDTVILGELALNENCNNHPLFYLQNLNEDNVWNAFDVVDIELPTLDSAPENAEIDSCGFTPQQLSGVSLADPLKAIGEYLTEIKTKPLWVNNLSFSSDILNSKAAERATLAQVVESDYLTRASGLLLAYGNVDKVFWKYDPQAGQPSVIALQSYANLSKTLSTNASHTESVSSSGFETLRFRKNGKLSILTWRTEGGDEAQPLLISNVEGYKLTAFSADAESLKTRKGVRMSVDDSGDTALMVSERPVLINGHLSDLKKSVNMTLTDNAEQANQELQTRMTGWVEVQKDKAADQLSIWVAKQQASLLDMLRDSFQQWLRQSLGLAKK